MDQQPTTIIGIDPGITGAIAAIFSDGSVSVDDPPTLLVGKRREFQEYEMTRTIDSIRGIRNRTLAFIEWAQAMPKQGVVSVFSYGQGFGIWLGILAAYGIPCTKVRPQAWKKVMLAGHGDTGKNASLAMARRLFPGVDLGRRKDAGRAEALLIASYGKRVLMGAVL